MGIDARHFTSPFKSMSRALSRLFPLDFSAMTKYPEGFGEMKGRYGHVLRDGEGGWEIGSADDVQSFAGGLSVGDSAGFFDKLGNLYGLGWALVKSTFDPSDPDPEDFYAYCTVQEVEDVMTTIMNLGAASVLTTQVVNATTGEVLALSTNSLALLDSGEATNVDLTYDGGLMFGNSANYAALLCRAPTYQYTDAHVVDCQLTPLSDWVQSATGPGLTLAAEKTEALAMGRVPLSVGNSIVSWSVSGTYVESTAFSGKAQLFKRSAAGDDTAIGDEVTLVEETGAFSAEHTLAAAEVMATGTTYFVKVTVTTGADDTAVLTQVLADVR